MIESCLIIGAGLSGLTAARQLQNAGVRVQIVDKGRSVGGRMATRRIEDNGQSAIFDHGAQFFTTRSDEFKAATARWQQSQTAREWFRGQSTVLSNGEIESSHDGHPRFRGAPSMTEIAKAQADGIAVLCETHINQLRRDGESWRARSEDGRDFAAQTVLLTAPVPQSLALLDSGDFRLSTEVRADLESIEYESCLAAMIWLDGPGRVPPPGALSFQNDIVYWLADNFQKGVSPVQGALTIHATPQWSREHWTDSDDEIVQALSNAVARFIDAEIRTSSVSRWKYSKPIVPREVGCIALKEARLALAGDAFAGAKVEGAFSSGLAAARALLAM